MCVHINTAEFGCMHILLTLYMSNHYISLFTLLKYSLWVNRNGRAIWYI